MQELLFIIDNSFAIDTALNGKLALDKIKQSKYEPYALIFLDINMPVLDGYEVKFLCLKLFRLQNI
jgi:CheY-like chemotaxis protein